MSAVLRPLCVYFALLLLFRLTGKRSLGELTSFDFVVLLIISESVSSGILAQDLSFTGAIVAAATLLLIDVSLSLLKQRFAWLNGLLEDRPVLLLRDGKLLPERLRGERVDAADILEAARRLHGIERLEDIKAAVLERRGVISIIPAPGAVGR
jgi:uncharacterized membrane protein YcaP (DUF421 family)